MAKGNQAISTNDVAEQRQTRRTIDAHRCDTAHQVVTGDAVAARAREDDVEVAERTAVQHGLVALARTFHQHLVDEAVLGGVELRLMFDLERQQVGAARVLHVLGHIVWEVRRRRSRSWRVHEHVGAAEAHLLHQRHGLREVVVA